MNTALEQQAATGTLVMDRGVLPTTEVVARVHRIQEVMKALMKEGTHFGTIPGTPKPTLYKPGAELLLMTFRIAASPSHIEDLSTPDEIRYRVTVRGTNQVSGEVVGEMSGECSSNEEKYRWRKPVCDEEFDEFPEDRRRQKWAKGSSGAYKQKQVRTSPADVANTILKMAIKRGLIALTLVSLGASDIFAQDLEDLTEELREQVAGEGPAAAPVKQPQRKSETGNGGGASTASSSAPKLPDNAQIAIGLVDKVWRPKDKKFFAVKLKGDDRLFTNWFDKFAQVEKDAKAFEGTDHRVKLAFTQNGNFTNIVGIAIGDAEPVAPPQAAGPSGPVDPSEYDPFSGAGRDPGSEG